MENRVKRPARRRNLLSLSATGMLLCMSACGPTDEAADAEEATAKPRTANLLADADMRAAGTGASLGRIRLDQDGELLRVEGALDGLPSGRYVLGIFGDPDCSKLPDRLPGAVVGADSAGDAAASTSTVADVPGYLGALDVGDDGAAEFSMITTQVALYDDDDRLEPRSLILHRDSGAADAAGDPTPGQPVACGAIEPVPTPTYVQ